MEETKNNIGGLSSDTIENPESFVGTFQISFSHQSLGTWRFVMQLTIVGLEQTPAKTHLLYISQNQLQKDKVDLYLKSLSFATISFYHLLSP